MKRGWDEAYQSLALTLSVLLVAWRLADCEGGAKKAGVGGGEVSRSVQHPEQIPGVQRQKEASFKRTEPGWPSPRASPPQRLRGLSHPSLEWPAGLEGRGPCTGGVGRAQEAPGWVPTDQKARPVPAAHTVTPEPVTNSGRGGEVEEGGCGGRRDGEVVGST